MQEIMDKPRKPRNAQYKQREIRTVYSLSQITKKIALPITAIGRSLQQTIEETIAAMVEGHCIVEGYVKPKSVRVITYSSGIIKGTEVIFDVVFECEVCFPVAGMLFNCVAKNITKAGIRAESMDEIPSPFVLFIARDHYYSNDYFNSIEENEKFVAKVIAQRFELNDKYVSIIAEIVTPKRNEIKGQPKPRIDFEE
jgi:DNA-directed RNA polymerase subunit E'/Rpb7